MDVNPQTKRLSRFEAQMVADYLKRKGKTLPSGWLSVYRFTPAEVAANYKITQAEVIKATRREIEEKE
ncbi:MAG: hypothetical protein LC130_33460 [Bryobacterales bacterium]|nr:hypothetical protein [Bryobacterales bacterium]